MISALSAVYRGMYAGNVVAVKVIETATKDKVEKAEAEGALSASLKHPNVVEVPRNRAVVLHVLGFAHFDLMKDMVFNRLSFTQA